MFILLRFFSSDTDIPHNLNDKIIWIYSLVPKVNPVRPTASKPTSNNRMAGDTGKMEELANQISEFKVCF